MTNYNRKNAPTNVSLFNPIFGLAFGRTPAAPKRATLSRRELRRIVADLIG